MNKIIQGDCLEKLKDLEDLKKCIRECKEDLELIYK